MEIRRFAAADAEAVLEIERLSQPTPWPLARFEAFSTLVAEAAGRVVGLGCYSVSHARDREEALLLANLSVHPECRRRGIGRALLEARLRIAAGARIPNVVTITRWSNEPLRALYRQYGFREGSRLPGYYGDMSEDGLVLYRALDADAEPPWRDAAPSPEAATADETMREAMEACERGDCERALELVDRIAGRKDIGVAARGFRVQLLDALGRTVEATLELERLVTETGAPYFHRMLGERYVGAGLGEAALSQLLMAVPVDGAPDPRLWSSLGVAWEGLGRYREAAWAYERLLRDEPQNPWPYGRLACTSLRFNRPARALELVDAALRLEEEIADLHKTRGLALWKFGRHQEARLSLRRALDIEPENKEAAAHLAALEAEVEAPRL